MKYFSPPDSPELFSLYMVFLKLFLLTLLLLLVPGATALADGQSLIQSIDLALTRSDFALELEEDLLLSQMDVAVAEHQFVTRVVPLTAIGIAQGTGTQLLGLEMRKQLPTGTALNYGVLGTRIDESTGFVVEAPTQAKAYIRISQGLLRRWGNQYNLSELTVAELRDKERQIETEGARQALIEEAVRKHYQLVLARQLLGSAETALLRSGEHLLAATSRQDIGLAAKSDVYRAELALLEGESRVQEGLRQVRKAEDAYRELLGLAADEAVTLGTEIDQMTPMIPEDWEANLLQTRLDWQAHQVRNRISRSEVARAEQDLLPDIGISFNLEQMGEGEGLEDALQMDQTNWSIQLELLSSLDRFEEESTLFRKKMAATRLKRAEQALQRKIRRETREAFADLQMEEQNHRINLKRRQQAAMALDLAKTRYEQGVSDNLDILDAESVFADAEAGISRSLVAYNLAAVALAQSLGVLDRQWIVLALILPDALAGQTDERE